jgi:hypothetical protein
MPDPRDRFQIVELEPRIAPAFLSITTVNNIVTIPRINTNISINVINGNFNTIYSIQSISPHH